MRRILFTTTLCCVALCGASVHAALKYWDINGTTAGSGQGTGAGTWNTTGSLWSTDSTGSSAVTTFVTGDTAVFSAGTDATGAFTINAPSGITASGITVEEGTVTLTGATITVGTSPVTINSGAKLSIGTSSAISASVGSTYSINGGTIENTTTSGAAGNFVSSLQTITVGASGATLSLPSSTAFVIIQTATGAGTTIGGTGGITKTGAGILAVATACNYSGSTTINGGIFRIRGSANRIPTGTATTVTSPGILDLNGVSQQIGSLTGNGSVTLGAATLTVGGSTSPAAFSGIISGGGSVTKSGSGTLTLSGANSYTGKLTVSAGALTVNSTGLLCGTICDVIINGGTVTLNNASQTIEDLAGTGGSLVLNGTALTATLSSQAAERTCATVISGTGSLIINGPTFNETLSGANTYSGSTTLIAGQTIINSTSTLGNGAGTLHLSGGTLTTSASRTASTAPVANPIDLTADSAITTTSTAATVDLNFSSSTIGGSAGTLTFRNDAASGTGVFQPRFTGSGFNFSRPIVINNGSFGTTVLNSYNVAATTQTFSGQISGTGSYKRNSSTGTGGTTIFASAAGNTYSGGTTVSVGTLLVNNTSGSGTGTGAVTVNSGGILGGTGIISGATTVNSGGTLTLVDSSVATLTFGSSLLLSGATSMEISKTAGTADKIVMTSGTVTLGGNLTVVNLAGTLVLGDTFDLIDGTIAGTFTSFTLPSLPTGLAWDKTQLSAGGNGTIKVVCDGTLAAHAGADQSLCYLVESAVLGGSPTATGGSGSYTYSWSSATGLDNPTLANPTASPTTTTTYTVTVTDSVGCTAMSSVTITVGAATAILTQPANTTVCSGSTATFSVNASGPGTIGYSWAKNDNGGWGSAWSVSGSGGTFRAPSTDNNFGDPACTSFSSANDINSPSGNSLGMWGGASGDTVATRIFAALTSGQVVSIDFDNGKVDSGRTNGFSLQTSGGADVLQFYFLGGASNYKYNDGTEQDTGIPFQRTGLRVEFALTSASAYTLIVTPCGGTATKFNGSYSGTIAQLKLFNQNTTGGNDYNIYFNNFLVGGYTDNADNYSGDYAGQDKGNQPIALGNGNSTYTTPVLSVADSGAKYQVVVSDCAGSVLSSAATVTVNPIATVDAGPAQTVCASSPATTLAGSFGGGASSATWSGAGTFAPNATTLNAVYTPTPGEIAAGTATVTLTTDDPTGPCGAVNASMTITINPAATVNAGPNQAVCASSPATTLAGSFGGAASTATWSGGAGTFTPDAATLNAVYAPTAGEIAAGTVTLTLTTDDPPGLCGPVSASMTITINPVATVNAGPPQTVCATSAATTLAGSFGGAASSATWSGAGTFAPNTTTLNAVYTPTPGEIAAGTATVTLTTDDPTGPCGAVNASMTITINPAATVNAGPNQAVCASSPATTLAGSFGGAASSATWSGGAGTFTPNAATLNAVYTPTAGEITAGTVTLTLTTDDPPGLCGPVSASMTVTIKLVATVDAGPAQTVCASSPATTLAGSFGGAASSATWSGAGTFAPNATTLNAVYTPTVGEITAGTATITLTTDDPTGPCGAVNASMTITINPAATVNAGPAQTVCASSPAATLAGSFGGAASSATWSGAGTFTPDATTLNAVYTPTAGEIAAGSATVTLTTDDPAGPCGAVNASMTITIQTAPAIADQPTNLTVCASSPAIFSVGATGAGLTYQWQLSGDGGTTFTNISDTETNASYTNLVTTVGDNGNQYQVIVSGACSPSVTSTPPAVLTVDAPATVDAGPAQTVCASSPAVTLAGSFGGAAASATWSGAGAFTPDNAALNAIYMPTAGEIAAGSATVTLTTDDPTGPCGAVSASMTITINPAVTVSAGPAQTVCASSSATTLAGSFGGAATTAIWSGAGNFAPNATTLNAVYTPTAGEIAAGTATVTMTTEDPAGPCGAVNSSMTITINSAATVSAGPAQTVCASSPATTLAGSFGGAATIATWSGAGTFAPNATTLNAVYTPTAGEIAAGSATVTLTTDDPAGPCGAVSASMTITINPAATVSAGPAQTACASSPATTLAGSFGGAATSATWSGAGSFAPNAATLNAVYTPTAGEIAAGTATVTLTTDDPAGPCGAVNASMTITINPVATVDAGPAQTVCASSPATTLAGSFGGAATSATWSGAGTFAPNATTLNAVYTPTAGEIAAGTATVTLITDDPAGPCSAVNASMTITINPAATVNAGPTQTVCASSPAAALAGSFGGAATSATWSGAGTFAPDATTLNAVYTPTAGEIDAGSATVTLTTDDPAGPCAAVSASMTITINPAATVNAGPNQTVCGNSPDATLAGSIGGSATSATWSGGAGTFAPNATTLNAVYTPTAGEITAGTVTLTLTTDDPAGPCGAVSASMTITIHAAPTAAAGSDQTVCSGSAAVIGGSPTASGGTGPYTYSWAPTTGLDDATLANPTATVTSTTTYTVTVTDANGCTGSDSVAVTVIPQPTITSITLLGTDVTLVWNSLAGQKYRVQYTTDLTPTITWTDVTPDVTAAGATATLTDSVGAAPQRFYRIKVVCP